ncbi:phage head completion protein, partial [Paracraurococcus lichenis]
MAVDIRIGDLRYEVTLARRHHSPAPDINDPKMVTSFTDRQSIRANIVPTGTMTYLNSIQTEINAITHRITIRWRAGIESQHVILR